MILRGSGTLPAALTNLVGWSILGTKDWGCSGPSVLEIIRAIRKILSRGSKGYTQQCSGSHVKLGIKARFELGPNLDQTHASQYTISLCYIPASISLFEIYIPLLMRGIKL